MSGAEQQERRLPEVRVGATPPDPLAISAAPRSLAAGPFHWAALATVATVAFAAEALKALVPSTIVPGDEIAVAGPLSRSRTSATPGSHSGSSRPGRPAGGLLYVYDPTGCLTVSPDEWQARRVPARRAQALGTPPSSAAVASRRPRAMR